MQIDVITSQQLISYPVALEFMEQKVKEIDAGGAGAIWLLQHPSLYTGGSSATKDEVLDLKGLPLYSTGRGGKTTYHGPGQSILYAMIPLKQLYDHPDLHKYISDLQLCIINTLNHYGIDSYTRKERIGVWCDDKKDQKTELKIAAIGVRVRKWITMHGIAINVNPDLEYFSRIIPCGIKDYGVTSCEAQGVAIKIEDLQRTLISEFLKIMKCKPGRTYEI